MIRAVLKRGVSALPEEIKDPLRQLKQSVKALPYRGEGRDCPVCGQSATRFLPYGVGEGNVREDAQCPHCGSLERHRLSWYFMAQQTDLFDGRAKRVLHVAPELCLERNLRKALGRSYITADLSHPRAMVHLDVMDIPYPNDYFDVVYCSHVLEHVPDDRQAMREIYRTLKPDGWAVLLVPIFGQVTFEDPSVTSPEERKRVFGQSDHVRIYGPDYIDRLREAGFYVVQRSVSALVQAEDARRMGLGPAAGDIYHCLKRSPHEA